MAALSDPLNPSVPSSRILQRHHSLYADDLANDHPRYYSPLARKIETLSNQYQIDRRLSAWAPLLFTFTQDDVG